MKRLRFLDRSLAILLILELIFAQFTPVHAESYLGLRSILYECVKYDQQADISNFMISQEELDALFSSMQDNGELPWYTYSYQLTVDTYGSVRSFVPVNLDPQTYDYDRYEQKLRQILSQTLREGMSQWQIALALHDYLVSHCAYDETKTYTQGYDALIRGTTVCNGYARAYQDLMLLAGIPCRYVSGNPGAEGHAWNLVQIDGSWYHEDATWDDPVPNVEGRVRHEYFLLTDEEILAREHYGWQTDVQCSNSLQGAYWYDTESPIFQQTVGQSFHLREEDWTWNVLARDDHTGDVTKLHQIKMEPVDLGEGDSLYSHYGLSLYNGRLYFSSLDTVYSMNLDGTDLLKIYWLDTAAEQKAIYGVFVDDNLLKLTFQDGENVQETQQLALGLPPTHHIHSYSRRDVKPTCFQEGYSEFSCACGDHYVSRFVAPTHKEEVKIDVAEHRIRVPKLLLILLGACLVYHLFQNRARV